MGFLSIAALDLLNPLHAAHTAAAEKSKSEGTCSDKRCFLKYAASRDGLRSHGRQSVPRTHHGKQNASPSHEIRTLQDRPPRSLNVPTARNPACAIASADRPRADQTSTRKAETRLSSRRFCVALRRIVFC